MIEKDTSHGNGSRAVIATMAFSNFALPFMFSGVGVTLPSMGRELAMSGASLGLFETLYLGTAAALMLPAGRLVDAGDKRSFFIFGVAGFALATLGLGLAPTVYLSLACGVLPDCDSTGRGPSSAPPPWPCSLRGAPW